MAVIPHTYPSGCVFSTLEDIKDKHITVMGLGLNGGGEASVRFFLKHGAYVLVTDMKTAEQLKPTIDAIAADTSLNLSRLTYHLGQHTVQDFASADCVIKNPGIKYTGNKFLESAKAVETDISIFLHFTKSPIIAVTGSKGKSSTVSAIHYGLCQAGFTAFLGGNITVSPLTFLDRTTETTPVVLELSSWQLADLRGRGVLAPHIAVITKIVPDHQNWYGNMEDYVADKRLIYAGQSASDYTILDADGDEPGTGPAQGGTWGNLFASETKGTVLRYSKKPLKNGTCGVWQETDADGSFRGRMILKNSAPVTVLHELSVPGSHMRTNVLNAALVLSLMGVAPVKAASILGAWSGIPHRLQYFHTYVKGSRTVKFYNDSCATVPEAAAAASQAFGKPVIFLTGGTDKGLAFTPLEDTLACRDSSTIPVKSLYLLAGTGTDKIIPSLDREKLSYNGPYPSLDAMLQAVKDSIDCCASSSPKEDIVVFSPGATSFGMFANEFDRGTQFMAKVTALFK